MSENSKKLYLVSLPFRLKSDFKGYSDIKKYGLVEASSPSSATLIHACRNSGNVNALSLMKALHKDYGNLEIFSIEVAKEEEMANSIFENLRKYNKKPRSLEQKAKIAERLAGFYHLKAIGLMFEGEHQRDLYGANVLC